ncbi:uncharacterized protein LOC116850748 isoform X3 [Odontomachus brunneus]|uniref:uncharacterized protein LOC116850748 isoform X3 n=1 Tax=Odontomachus brunneus TaxID=486640 RepID=UPI0013F2B1A0|nr:uncharacterized protein LOC116850748 isoform X3 [Odontomachus brunneus]
MLLDKLLPFDEPYTKDKYNQFFNPNICHVCKRPSENLITCNKCNMISYCSKEHQEEHKFSHLDMCNAIAIVITDTPFWVTYRNSEEWIESRREIVLKILNILSRPTYGYETEMVMCAKSCSVCYQQLNIKPCKICYSANFCDDHEKFFNLTHTDCCAKLLLLLNMNITYTNDLETMGKKVHGRKFTKFPGPMTLYYALQESNLLCLPTTTHKYIVHLIDADRIDVMSSGMWHIFLHIFINMKELYIVFIKSPKFESKDLENMCAMCCYNKRKLYVKYVSEPYHDYVRLESFEQPNVIVLLETETIWVRTWFKSIKAVVAQNCPLLLTTDSKSTAEENVDRIQEETDTSRTRLYRKNKFCGCTPYRDYITGGFYYRNAHFIMYS